MITRAFALVACLAPVVAPAVTPVLGAQSAIAIPIALNVGVPQGEFAENVRIAGGVGGGVLWRIGGVFGLRADLGAMIYGSDTRRVPLGGGALGLINVDVTTTNSIFGGSIGAQVGVPGPRPTPYLGGNIGFSAFTTSSSVSGSNSDDEPFASSTNSNDGTFAKSVMGGFYIPVGKTRTAMFDIGVRHTWNGEQVRYLTPGDIEEDPDGNVVLNPRQTRADFLTIVIGFTFSPGRKAP